MKLIKINDFQFYIPNEQVTSFETAINSLFTIVKLSNYKMSYWLIKGTDFYNYYIKTKKDPILITIQLITNYRNHHLKSILLKVFNNKTKIFNIEEKVEFYKPLLELIQYIK